MQTTEKEPEFIKFESINKDRANDIAGRFLNKEYRVTRAEVILTDRCQLKCSYCQKHLGVNGQEKRIDSKILRSSIQEWLDHGCKFIHFTGGEATLCEELPEYVAMCHEAGAEVTLSTNATSDLQLYKKLVETGVNCFHISLDTKDPHQFDKQVGVEHSFEKVLKTIQLITKMRDEEHYDTKLVINTCITLASFHDLIEIVEFMLSLKPNDLKLIPVSQLKDKWTDYAEKYETEMKPVLQEMIPDGPGFHMFRGRVNNLVKQSFRGYNHQGEIPPCYLSADERTVNPEGNYYGCYINYREGAEPIGTIAEDSFIEQSEKLRKHMRDFTDSEICQRYCADITVLCNKYIDKMVCHNRMQSEDNEK